MMSALWVFGLIFLFDGPDVPVVRADDTPFSLALAPSSFLPYQSYEADLELRELFAPTPFSWYGETGVVFLDRTRSNINLGYQLGLVQPAVNGSFIDVAASDNRFVSTRDLDGGPKTGLRFLVGRTIWTDPCDDRGCAAKPTESCDAFRSLSIELGYLGLLQQQSTVRYAANPSTPGGALTSRFVTLNNDGSYTPVLWPFDFANVNTIVYRSRFDSAELNLRYSTAASHRMPIEMLAGIRYLKLQENLDYLASNNNPHLPALIGSPSTGLYSARTDNDLIGLQLGGDLSYRLTSDWSLMGRGRGGLLVNSASQRSNLQGTLVSTALPYNDSGTGSGVGFAGLFEFGIHTNYQLSSNVTLTVGYQGLILSELSTAPRQMLWSLEPGSRNGLDRNSSLFYFGPAAGIEWKW